MPTQDQLRMHIDRAVLALSRGALDDAVHEFSQAIYLDPRDVMLRQRLGDLLARMGRKQEAIAQFQQVTGHYAAKGELLRAIAISRAILDLDPSHKETQAALAKLYAKQSGAGVPQRLPSSMSGATPDPDRPQAGGKTAALDLADLQAVFSHPNDPPARSPQRAPPAQRPAVPWDTGPAAPSAPMHVVKPIAPINAAPSTHGRGKPADEIVDLSTEAVVDLSTAKSTPLFSMLDKESFLLVCEKLALRWVKAGEAIVREGEPGDSMFVVVQGTVNVVREQPGSTPKLVAAMGDGSFFGEMALVARSPRLATVFAATDGLLFEIDRAALDNLALQHPAVERVVQEFFRDRLLNNLLAASPIFRSFLPDERKRIAARFTMVSLPAGAKILEQGRQGAGLFVLLRGQCEAFHTSEDGSQHAYPTLREGDVFGEISLLFGSAVTATVRTLTHVEVLELPEAAFNELVRPHKPVRDLIDKMARERLTRTTDLLLSRDEVMDTWLI